MGRDGILLDLSRMNQVGLSEDGQVASIEPGARWGEVTATLAPYNATVIGARIPHVGVGGLVLGGM